MTDTFDAVLAELREGPAIDNQWADRLAAAHAAEVAERDARIALLESDEERVASCPWRVQKGATALCQPPRSQSALLARAEAAELELQKLLVASINYRKTMNGSDEELWDAAIKSAGEYNDKR